MYPPSTESKLPVTKLESDELKNKTAFATSSGRPTLDRLSCFDCRIKLTNIGSSFWMNDSTALWYEYH